MKKQMHMVNDRSMMDWLADEEFNTMTQSGSGSGYGYGCGYKDDDSKPELGGAYVYPGSITISGGDPISVGVQVSWTGGYIGGIGGATLTAKAQSVEYDTTKYFDIKIKHVSARWTGSYGIAVEGQYSYHKFSKKPSEQSLVRYGNIMGGGSVPESLRGKAPNKKFTNK